MVKFFDTQIGEYSLSFSGTPGGEIFVLLESKAVYVYKACRSFAECLEVVKDALVQKRKKLKGDVQKCMEGAFELASKRWEFWEAIGQDCETLGIKLNVRNLFYEIISPVFGQKSWSGKAGALIDFLSGVERELKEERDYIDERLRLITDLRTKAERLIPKEQE